MLHDFLSSQAPVACCLPSMVCRHSQWAARAAACADRRRRVPAAPAGGSANANCNGVGKWQWPTVAGSCGCMAACGRTLALWGPWPAMQPQPCMPTPCRLTWDPSCHLQVQREALYNNSFMVNGGKIGFPCQASKGPLLKCAWEDPAEHHACPAWWQCMAA